eukprot:366082-Chlamydomonas_euryale.AAC.32
MCPTPLNPEVWITERWLGCVILRGAEHMHSLCGSAPQGCNGCNSDSGFLASAQVCEHDLVDQRGVRTGSYRERTQLGYACVQAENSSSRPPMARGARRLAAQLSVSLAEAFQVGSPSHAYARAIHDIVERLTEH